MVGRQLSRYRIVEEVGSGGMAVVYRGLDTSLDREVAVKVLHPHLAGKEESRRRFSREAQAVAKLHHPNILEIYDFSGADGTETESFIITEFIRGKTLRQLAELHPFHPPELAAMALHELADALEHAHAIGVIHRDIKPENVMIRDDGCLKLMDFGIAKILDRDERMTLTGALVGSPAHMAPEIIEGEEAGPEADIFSLGTILYWLCTRKLPFFAANTTATLKRILDAEYDDPRMLNPAVSDALAEVIARCLAREPKDRFASAGALRDTLAGMLRDAGFASPAEQLALFFADPSGGSARIAAQVVEKRLIDARTRIEKGNPAGAMAALGQVLALDAHHREALALLESLKRRARTRKRVGLAALTVVALGFAGAGGVAAYRAQHRPAPSVAVVRPRSPDHNLPAPIVPPIPSVPIPVKQPSPGQKVAAVEQERRTPVRREPERKPQGSVLIKVFPYADIYIDAAKVASGANSFPATLAAGRHQLRFEHSGMAPKQLDVDIPAGGQAREVRVRLDPLPWHLVVRNRQNAGVEVDGKLVGTSNMSLARPFEQPMPLDASGQPVYRTTVKLTLSQQGFKDWSALRTVEAGETLTVAQELAPQ